MRKSNKTNTLVIVSNHVGSIYDDRWVGDTIHYTGMGRSGDQSLEFMQNKTLAQSGSNGVRIHLFEVFERKVYTYSGEVVLLNKPYFESQPDADGRVRQACIFPLRLANQELATVESEALRKSYEKKVQKAKQLSDEELKERARSVPSRPGSRKVSSNQHERSPWVSEYTKRLAAGICQLCSAPAPFSNKKGEPYLETHHIEWLSRGGADDLCNTVALCPNCHKKMHILDDKEDIKRLITSSIENALEVN